MHARRSVPATILCLLLLAVSPSLAADDPIEIFDAHLHYNWEPTPMFTVGEVAALLRRQRGTGILATSRPYVGTHALVEAKAEGLWVVPFIRPYRVRADMTSWMGDPKIFDLVQEEFKRGGYRGIGEFHLWGRKPAANEWVRRLVDFAVDKGLFLHCHCDEEALETLYEHNPKARIVWAHTGFSLDAGRVEALLAKHSELWGELSYRSGIIDDAGKLTPAWRDLFERRAARFLVGTDTWTSERWLAFADIIAGYRAWLAQLSPGAAASIAHGNARRLFGQ